MLLKPRALYSFPLILQTPKLYLAVTCRTEIVTRQETIQILKNQYKILWQKTVCFLARMTIKARYEKIKWKQKYFKQAYNTLCHKIHCAFQHTVPCNTFCHTIQCAIQYTVPYNTLCHTIHSATKYNMPFNILYQAIHCAIQYNVPFNTLYPTIHFAIQYTVPHNKCVIQYTVPYNILCHTLHSATQ